ncbi:MAG: type II secretion system GspH family protein [Oscillospiraceae bacterium]|nr:type II secretion system GspH family protein [Oscillospiraceae bacterium]
MKFLIKMRNKKGFTLVECVIAILVFSIMALIVATLLMASINYNEQNKETSRSMITQRERLGTGSQTSLSSGGSITLTFSDGEEAIFVIDKIVSDEDADHTNHLEISNMDGHHGDVRFSGPTGGGGDGPLLQGPPGLRRIIVNRVNDNLNNLQCTPGYVKPSNNGKDDLYLDSPAGTVIPGDQGLYDTGKIINMQIVVQDERTGGNQHTGEVILRFFGLPESAAILGITTDRPDVVEFKPSGSYGVPEIVIDLSGGTGINTTYGISIWINGKYSTSDIWKGWLTQNDAGTGNDSRYHSEAEVIAIGGSTGNKDLDDARTLLVAHLAATGQTARPNSFVFVHQGSSNPTCPLC